MASLTDNLNDPNYTPPVRGGSAQDNIFGGLADIAGQGLKLFANNKASQKTTKENDIAIDELSMGIFQQGTGISLSDPARDDMVYAERLEKAKKAGTLDATAYDIRMQGVFADVLRKYPNEASDIMSYAKEKGINHYLFRQMEDENKKADALVDQSIQAEANLLTYATEKGLWDPRTGNRNQAMSDALVHRAELTAQEARNAALDETIKNFNFNDPKFQAQKKQLEQEVVNGVLGELDMRSNGAMREIYAISDTAYNLGDKELTDTITGLWDEALMGVTMMGENMRMYMRAKSIEGTTADGKPVRIPFDKNAQEQLEGVIKQKTELFTMLKNKPLADQKAFIEKMKLDSELTDKQVFPTIDALKQATGGSIMNVFEWITYPDKYGLAAGDVAALKKEFAEGTSGLVKNSAQSLAQARQKLEMPSSSNDPNVAIPSTIQAGNFLRISRGLLTNGKFATPADQNAALDMYENSMTDLTYMLNKVYMPNVINTENAKVAQSMMINKNTFADIDNYIAKGGDPELGELYRSQITISGANFVSTLARKGQEEGRVTYDPMTHKFKAKETSSDRLDPEASGLAGMGAEARTRKNLEYANTLNSYLDFMDFASTKTEVIPADLVKTAGINVRDFLARGMSLEQINSAIAVKSQEQADLPNARELFDQAVDSFDFDSELPSQWTNGQRQSGGANPFDSEEDWQAYEQGLTADESRGVKDARPINRKTGKADSSALGVHQFLDETWMKFAQDEDWAQGLSRSEILEKRKDPATSSKILKEFTADNGRILSEELGRKPVAEELRMAHFSGPDGAVKVLQADNSTKIDAILSAAKQAKDPDHVNFRMFYSGVDQEGKPKPKTVGEYMKQFGVN